MECASVRPICSTGIAGELTLLALFRAGTVLGRG
jgi:hypothetical protein